jgi:endonuclease/exonuclease/phosphatase family metal-dependent hydrolase
MKKLLLLIFTFSLSSQAVELSLLSYNTWLLPGLFMTAHKPRRRVHAIAKYLKENPRDIIGLQEVFTPRSYRQFSKVLLQEGYYSTGRPNNNLRFLSSGLIIFSKYPILAEKFKRFNACSEDDCLSSKGLLAVLINVDGKPLYLVNGHLQSGGSVKRTRARGRQILEFKRFLEDDFFKLDAPIIIMGDFNVAKSSPQYNTLIDTLELSDEKLDGEMQFSYDGKLNKQNIRKGNKSRQLLDYIFMKRHAGYGGLYSEKIVAPIGSYKKNRDIDLSDHFAIESKLYL